MEPEENMHSLSYETMDERSRRGGDTAKKRLNKKEQRERAEKIDKRSSQRTETGSLKAIEEEKKRLEELNELVTAKGIRKQEEEAKRQNALTRKEENRKLFHEAMVKDAVGVAPSSEDAREHQAYEQRLQAFQQSLNGTARAKPKATVSTNRAALLKSMAAHVNTSS